MNGPWNLSLDGAMREWLANRFASELLTPSPWFLPDSVDLDFDLEALKRRYQTASYEVIASRTLDVRFTRHRDDIRQRYTEPSHGQSSRDRPAALLDLNDRVVRKVPHRRGSRPAIRVRRGKNLACQMKESWKREIMRTEPVVWE